MSTCGTFLLCYILDPFAKFRKITISFVMSVRLSAWNNSASTGRIFIKFEIRLFFEKVSRSFIKIGQEYRENYMKINTHFYHISLNSS